MHGNILYANSKLAKELNWQHRFSKLPLSSDSYPFPQDINRLFSVLWSFPPSYFSSASSVFPVVFLGCHILYFLF